SFPTGNATAGGDFVMSFDVISTQVIGLTPTYDATASRTLNVEVTFNGALDPATLTEANIRLVNGGGSGEQVIPDELVYDPDTGVIRLVYTGGVPDGDYVLTVADEVLNIHGDALDGEFVPATGLPSGDGLAGGDFVAGFSIVSPARVVAINPAPGESLKNPATVEIVFSEPLLPAYINADSFSVTGDGADDILGTADDIIVNFTSISLSPDARTVTLNLGGAMPEDTYHVMITPSRIPLSPSVVESFTGGPANPALWQVNGDASFTGGYVQLTPNAVGAGGNMFYVPEIWTGAFRVMFDFRISSPPGRYGFVMGWAETDDVSAQGDYTAEGGNMMGFDGIASNAYGVEFDMSGDSWGWDYNHSHVGLIEDTAANHLTWTAFTNPSDGTWHSADITVSGGVVRVLVDGVERINYVLGDYDPFLGRLFFTSATATTTYSNEYAIDNLMIYADTPDTLPGIRGTDGLLVDTEFSDGDSLPSGDGVPGGVFHSRFNADSIGPKVVAVSPESARLFREGYHTRIEITFNEDIGEEQGADPSHYQVFHNFTNPVIINLVIYDPNTRTVTLVINDGQPLADGSYQITVFGNGPDAITDEAGNRLDGEFNGEDWPSGNDAEGGDFQYAFSVDSNRPKIVATNPTDGGVFSVGSIHTIQVYYSEDIPIVEATDSNNYRIRASGDDNSFKEGNEYYVRINYVTYDSINRIATIGLNDGFDLGDESYQLKIYSTTIHDLAGHVLDGNENLLSRDNFIMTFTVDTSHPEIIASDPSVAIEYVTDPNFDHIDLLFDDSLLPVEATDPSNYTVRRSGNDGTFNDGNEVTIAIDHVEWAAGSRIVSVYLDTTDLPEDSYQLLVHAGSATMIQVTNSTPSAEIGSGVMALADGGWAVVDRAGDDLLLLDSRGSLLQTVNIGGSGGILPTALNLGNHVSQLPDGTFMLIDSVNDWLIFVRPDGSLATEYGTVGGAVDGVIDVSFVQGGAGIQAAASSYAGGIAVIDNINSDLILLDNGGTKIGAVNIGGTNGLVPAATGLGGSMIELADGTLAITDVATGSIILVNPVTGQLVTDYGTGGVIGVNAAVPGATTPQGLAEMPGGTIAVFDTAGDRLIFFNPDGSLDVTRGTGGVLTPASGDWAGVTGLTRNGSLYLADQASQRIRAYRDNGAAGSIGIQDLAGNIMLSDFELEFTFDNSGPVMTDANPAPASSSQEYVSMIEVWLNEELDPFTANDPANYEIRGWGANGIFGDSDDVIYDFYPHYSVDPSGGVSVQLTPSSPLLDGCYQVTLIGETSIRDNAGNHLND
ncbi:MAG: Ig-like domain-containing protein, partial [Gammaproteobacteria bacterium]